MLRGRTVRRGCRHAVRHERIRGSIGTKPGENVANPGPPRVVPPLQRAPEAFGPDHGRSLDVPFRHNQADRPRDANPTAWLNIV